MRNTIAAGFAVVVLAALGVFILHKFETTLGLIIGSGCVLGALAIAVPTQLHRGIVVVKNEAAEIRPIVDELRKGGGDAA